MLKRPGKIRRGLIVIGTAVPSIGSFAAALWRSDGGKKWLAPLAVFLCLTGLILVLGSTVEALAPFIYSIF